MESRILYSLNVHVNQFLFILLKGTINYIIYLLNQEVLHNILHLFECGRLFLINEPLNLFEVWMEQPYLIRIQARLDDLIEYFNDYFPCIQSGPYQHFLDNWNCLFPYFLFSTKDVAYEKLLKLIINGILFILAILILAFC